MIKTIPIVLDEKTYNEWLVMKKKYDFRSWTAMILAGVTLLDIQTNHDLFDIAKKTHKMTSANELEKIYIKQMEVFQKMLKTVH